MVVNFLSSLGWLSSTVRLAGRPLLTYGQLSHHRSFTLYVSTDDYPNQHKHLHTKPDELAALDCMVQRGSTELRGWLCVATTQVDTYHFFGELIVINDIPQ